MTRVMPWTIRARITALVAALVMAVGGALLMANYGWFTSNLPTAMAHQDGGETFVVVDGAEPVLVAECARAVTVDDAAVPQAMGGPAVTMGPAVPFSPSASAPQPTGPAQAASIPVPVNGDCILGASVMPGGNGTVISASVPPEAIRSAIQATSQGLTTEIVRQMGRQSVILLVVLTMGAIVAGWLAARRALAPIHAMNERVRQLGAASLSERLPLAEPRDEIRELGETFNGMLERVEQAVAREHRLVANLAHELRTPVANQRIVLEMALEETEAGGPGASNSLERAARTALQQNLRTQRLIEQLLLLARIEQAKDDVLEVVDVDLNESVEMLIAGPALARLGPAGVTIDFEPAAPARATVRGEPLLLDCLVANLLENAVRHNVPGGMVRVSFPPPQPGTLCELLIENSGPVVPADVVPSLFQPLRRGPALHRDRQRGRVGIGLGLSLVVAIAERFGVVLDVQPRVEGGLSVRLRWLAHPVPRAP